jgi:predicted metalloenzyme YecM
LGLLLTCSIFGVQIIIKRAFFILRPKMTEDTIHNFSKEALKFVSRVFEIVDKKFSLESYNIDHLCYRVENPDQYEYYKGFLNKHGKLLVESTVGGRSIATYKLFNPLHFNDQVIQVIELPFPKVKNKYLIGFEHLEIVVPSLEEIIKIYPINTFDMKGFEKKSNRDIRFQIDNCTSIKFHEKSLEEVIEEEKIKK